MDLKTKRARRTHAGQLNLCWEELSASASRVSSRHASFSYNATWVPRQNTWSSNHPAGFRPEEVFFIPNGTASDIRQLLDKAVRFMKEYGVSRLFMYYAGHSVATFDDPSFTIIEPQRADKLYLVKALTRILRERGPLDQSKFKARLFFDSCAQRSTADSDEEQSDEEPCGNICT